MGKQLPRTDGEYMALESTRLSIGKHKHNSDVQIMASGGNVDWAPEYARSNTRAEQTHILAAMIKLFETGINVTVLGRLHWSDRQLQ